MSINHGTRRQSVVRFILSRIFNGEYAPGARLRVEHLAEECNVSVTPIREALVELAGVGVIELQPNRGAEVRAFGPKQLWEICHLRRILECEAVRGCVGHFTPSELEQMEADFSRLSIATRDEDWLDETKLLDTQLHTLISERCGNERLSYEINRYAVLYRTLRDARHSVRTARANYSEMEENNEHLAIVQGLIKQDRAAAADAMGYHVNQAGNALVQDLFGKQEIADSDLDPYVAEQVAPTEAP